MNSPLDEIAARLRSIRRSRGLTLIDVQVQSGGGINAISLGSYERSDRALTVKKAHEIADFYEIPLAYLLTGHSPTHTTFNTIIIDLRRVREFTQSQRSDVSLTHKILLSFIAGVINLRQDFNGEVLSLREKDFEYLTLSIGCSIDELVSYLQLKQLLVEVK